MKKNLVVLVMLVSSSAFAGPAHLKCSGTYKSPYANENGVVNATVASDTELTDVTFSRANVKDGVEQADAARNKSIDKVDADANYNPRKAIFQNMNRFQIGYDGWTTDSLLLPSTIPTGRKFFDAYLQAQGEVSDVTIKLTCIAQ